MKTFLNFQQLRFGLRILTLGLLIALAVTAAAQQKSDNAYVVNVTTVSVIDVSSDAVIATIASAERPTTVAIQPKTKDDLTQDVNDQ